MPLTQEARVSPKKTGAPSPPKKNSSSPSRATKAQAQQASPNNRRKCELCVAVTGGRSRNELAGSPKAHTRAELTSCSDGGANRLKSSLNECEEDDPVSDIISKLDIMHGHLTGTSCEPPEAAKVEPSKVVKGLESRTVSTSMELGDIQQSTKHEQIQVERLSRQNEELERQLVQQIAEIEFLHRELSTLRGIEQENEASLQRTRLLEKRAYDLEGTLNSKTMELKTALEKLRCVEQERDQLRNEIQSAGQEHHEHAKTLKGKQRRLLQRIEQLERLHGAQSDDQKSIERHWKEKMTIAARASSEMIDALQQQLEQSHNTTKTLQVEVQQLEEQVENLLATTVRQTSLIEECDRALSDTKAQQQQAERKYEEQLRLSCELSAKASLPAELEKELELLKNKLAKHNDTLRDKDKEVEAIQHAFVTKEEENLHLVEANKGLQRREKRWKSDISELQIALRDATDEINLLSEQVLALQEQMESERKDRSRWATARLKLLAEFCDEESKVGSADVSRDDQKSTHIEKQQFIAPQRRKTKNKRATRSQVADDQSYDGDDSDKELEQRRSSIVFG